MNVNPINNSLDVHVQLTEAECELLRKEGFTHIAGFNLRTTGGGLWAKVTRPQLNQLTMELEQAKFSARAREVSKGPIELSPGESSEVIEIASNTEPKKEEPTMPEVKPTKSILRQEADVIIERSAPQLLARRTYVPPALDVDGNTVRAQSPHRDAAE